MEVPKKFLIWESIIVSLICGQLVQLVHQSDALITSYLHYERQNLSTLSFKLVLLFEFLPLLKNISEKISHLLLLLLFLLVENYEVISKPQPKTIKPKFPMWEDTTDWR